MITLDCERCSAVALHDCICLLPEAHGDGCPAVYRETIHRSTPKGRRQWDEEVVGVHGMGEACECGGPARYAASRRRPWARDTRHCRSSQDMEQLDLVEAASA